MTQSYHTLGQCIGAEGLDTAGVVAALASLERSLLLVLDNCDDLETDYAAHLPTNHMIDVLITSRMPEIEEHCTVGSERLDQLDEREACHLLAVSAGVDPTDYASNEHALAIVRELGRHTLAVIQAGSFIRRACTAEEYSTFYRADKGAFLKHRKRQNASRFGSVHHTFETCVTRLQSMQDLGNTTAAQALLVLDILALVPRGADLEDIFNQVGRQRQPICFDLNDSKFGVPGDVSWRKACLLLEDFSLISLRADHSHPIPEMHPLIQTWATVRQPRASKDFCWLYVAGSIAAAARSHTQHAALAHVWPGFQGVRLEDKRWATKYSEVALECIDIFLDMHQEDVSAGLGNLRPSDRHLDLLVELYAIEIAAFPKRPLLHPSQVARIDRLLAFATKYDRYTYRMQKLIASQYINSTSHSVGIERLKSMLDPSQIWQYTSGSETELTPWDLLPDRAILAIAYVRARRFAEGREFLSETLPSYPTAERPQRDAKALLIRLWYLQAVCAYETGQRSLAIKSAQRAVDLKATENHDDSSNRRPVVADVRFLRQVANSLARSSGYSSAAPVGLLDYREFHGGQSGAASARVAEYTPAAAREWYSNDSWDGELFGDERYDHLELFPSLTLGPKD